MLKITYQESVRITAAIFGDQNILQSYTTSDNITYTFMPNTDFNNGAYNLSITAIDTDDNTLVLTSDYNIKVATEPEAQPTEEFLVLTVVIIIIIVIVITIVFLVKTGFVYRKR